MCIFPKYLQNPKYKPNKKNGGQVPPITDPRVMYVPIPCGECIECKKQESNKWKARLAEDIKQYTMGKFVTLTFNEESLKELREKIKKPPSWSENAINNAIAIYAVRRFCERWRKKYKVSIRHWLITELGHNGTERIHLHGILWTDKVEDIKEKWQYGYVFIGKWVNEQTINYIMKYVTKVDLQHKGYKAVILASPGIGEGYTKSYNAKLNKFNDLDTVEHYTTPKGQKTNMPTYWRNKIYNEEERERLWLNKLDKGVRYVLGQKCETEEEYLKAVEQARKKNKELGYIDIKNYNQKKYMDEIKEIKGYKKNKET